MIKIILFLGVFLYTSISNAQVATAISIYDTRSVNEAPNFLSHSIRADFKERSIMGVPGSGFYSTNLTIGQWGSDDNSGDKKHQLNFNNGGVFYRNAYPLDSHWGNWRQIIMANDNGNVGIGTVNPLAKLEINNGNLLVRNIVNENETSSIMIAHSVNVNALDDTGTSIRTITKNAGGNNYAMQFFTEDSYLVGQTEKVRILGNGNVGIGTISPNNKLDVNGTIHSKEVKVDMEGWSDFVFKKEYNLPKLEEVEKHIAEKGHLKNIPSEEEVLENGINLGEMNAKLLQKIEELTLYIIKQEKKSSKQETEIGALKKENEVLKNVLERLGRVEEKLKKCINEK